jgi:hypothetical protein
MHLESYQAKIEPLELYSSIQTIEFSPTMVPLYMQDVDIPNDIVSQRLQSSHLTQYHHEFRYHS